MIKKICIYITLFILLHLISSSVSATEIKSYLVTEEQEFYGDPHLNTVYYYKNIPIFYKSGKVVISANPDGTGEATVGEEFDVSVTYPGSGYFMHRPGCPAPYTKMPPLDITHLMHDDKYGPTNLSVRFIRRQCPETRKIDNKFVEYMKVGPLYVVHFDDYEPTAEPFLDLPWDYAGKGQSFEDAALKISSYFDHAYPLLSTNLAEPIESSEKIVNYSGETTDKPYSKHDGYDYAINSNVKLNDPVLAAASGEASYIDSCGLCGNAIHIDHGNGYQTRYYHLQPDGLITNNPNQKVQVTNRQQIGKVGLTGNTDGAHIHFMVIKDKNGDGNFDDNIPDGLVDPYGWQSNSSDPWAQYTFDWYGEQRTGTKSHYMWKTSISGLKKTLSADGGTFNTHRHSISFPKDFTINNLILSLKSIGVSNNSNSLQPIGQGINITLWDGINTFFTEFQKNFTLKFKFLNIDTSRFNQDSISMYSSIDGINWEKESTTIDWENLEATMQANHLTQFALLGEKLDSIPPVTTAIISGTEVTNENQINVYSTSVTMTLLPTDEPQENSLGIDYTLYKVNDGEWTLYENPIQFNDVKPYAIQYYSVDKDGNTEDIKNIEFSIIEVKNPEFEIFFNFDTNEFELIPVPSNLTITSEVVKKKKKDLTLYTVSSGSKSTSITTNTKVNSNKHILKILSLGYENSIIPIEKEKLSIEFINNSNEKKGNKIKQIFNVSDTMRIVLLYSEKNNSTKITIRENDSEKQIETVEGFKRILLNTNEGNIDYKIQ